MSSTHTTDGTYSGQDPRNNSSGAPAGAQSLASKAILITTAVVGGFAILSVGVTQAIGDPLADIGRSITGERGPFSDGWTPPGVPGDDWEGPFSDDTDSSGDADDFDWSDGQVRSADWETAELMADVSGVTELDVEVTSVALTIEFADVDEAELVVESYDASEWKMTVDGEELRIEDSGSNHGAWGSLGKDDDGGIATLTLPSALDDDAALTADIAVEAGAVTGSGRFRELDLSVDVGRVEFSGTAQALDLSVDAGEAVVSVADVARAELEVGAGEAAVQLTGEPPAAVDAQVGVGQLVVELPEAEYAVEAGNGIGAVENELATDAASDLRIRADVGVGRLVLR